MVTQPVSVSARPETADTNPIGVPYGAYAAVIVLTAAVLLYTVVEQIYDTNFYVLWEATAVLAGDRPYRDFYPIGWPLLTALSALLQWLVGYRLIGEFLLHWSFIIAGMLVGFHLALRLSRSIPASLLTMVLALVVLAGTPTFHFPKIFWYPMAVWVGWRYMERPGLRRAAVVGLVTAAAFLSRHDHGLYIGVASLLAFVLARALVPEARSVRASLRDAAAYAAAAAIVVVPWAIIVASGEGLDEFVRTRAEWGETWAPARSPYAALLSFNPVRLLDPRDGWLFHPSRDEPALWLVQVTLLLPLIVLASACADGLAGRRRPDLAPDTCRAVLAAAMVAIVSARLLREHAYFVVVLPLTAALGARLLSRPERGRTPMSAKVPGWVRQIGRLARRTLVIAGLGLTGVAAVGFLDPDLFAATELEEVAPAYRQLFASPPIDGYQPADEAFRIDRGQWLAADEDDRRRILIRYVHDCTRTGDRVFVTGSTPYHVGYYAERAIAGGHLQWHHRWRADPADERRSLALLQRQSVPFAVSTHDPVLKDLGAYPLIHAYMAANYVEVDGTEGRLLVDKRRRSTAAFGALGWPCLR